MRVSVLLVIVGLIFIGCNNRSSNSLKEIATEDSITPQGIKNGVLNLMTAQTDPSCRYGLYIPKDSCKKYPLIVIFDPHAAGNHAASQYQELADKYKVVLAASNNIQNNMPSDRFVYYANCMIDDVMNICTVDSDFVYLMGFSGGARVASYIAQTENVFRGIVACGAGIQDIVNIRTSNFLYVGFAGYSDFNFSEVYKTESALRQSLVKAHFKYFEGKHEWPPDTIMEYAFATIALDMKLKFTNNITTYLNKEISNCKNIPIRDAWKKVVNYKSLKDLLENIVGFDNEKGIINNYLPGYEAKTAERNFNNSLSSEAKLQVELQKAFIEKDQVWWDKKISLLNAVNDKKGKSPSDYRDIRLLNYISMSCYMLTNSALKNEDMSQVTKFLKIYRLVDPANPDVSYLSGVSLAINKQYQEAIDSLSSSLKKGFSDKGKWQSERAFIPLKDSLRFIDLEAKLNAIP
jgi:hypothetical protein